LEKRKWKNYKRYIRKWLPDEWMVDDIQETMNYVENKGKEYYKQSIENIHYISIYENEEMK
jgi:hypothetical protein